MSDTPRTDAKIHWCDQSMRDNLDDWPTDEFIHFTRQLERELAAAKEKS
jgi:hypothetical protein